MHNVHHKWNHSNCLLKLFRDSQPEEDSIKHLRCREILRVFITRKRPGKIVRFHRSQRYYPVIFSLHFAWTIICKEVFFFRARYINNKVCLVCSSRKARKTKKQKLIKVSHILGWCSGARFLEDFPLKIAAKRHKTFSFPSLIINVILINQSILIIVWWRNLWRHINHGITFGEEN